LSSYNLSDRQPTLLTCFHTFCGRCLNQIQKNEEIVCPTCRKTTSSNVHLVPNYALRDALEALFARKKSIDISKLNHEKTENNHNNKEQIESNTNNRNKIENDKNNNQSVKNDGVIATCEVHDETHIATHRCIECDQVF
jgi:hypothetical protein